jgi:NTE family protein
MRAIIAAAEDAADLRRRLCAAALEMDASADGSWPARWRATVAARLPSQHWPERLVLITAIDAHTGEPVVFDRHSGLQPRNWGMHLATQVDELRARGSRVETVFPDLDAEHLFGANAMDLSLRPAAARAGYDQGRARAEQLTVFWR